MRIFGIDPGLLGALAILDDKKIVDVIDLPTMSDGKKNKRQLNSAHLSQYIKNNIPFLDNREYCFRISKESLNDLDTLSLVHWYLLEKNYYKTAHLVEDNKSIYLNYGAGLWLAEKQTDQSFMISYIIYIDPGGSIPDFLINKANRVSLVNILKDTINEANRRLDLSNS